MISNIFYHIVVPGIIFYILLVVFLYFYQRNMVFYPSGPNPFESDYQPFQSFTYEPATGLTLRGLIASAQKGKPTIIFFQGNAGSIGNRLYKTKYFLPHGFGFVMVGYRGYSGNSGSPSEEGLYDDARSAVQFVLNQGIPQSDIILYGESLGTGVAVQMATEFPGVKAVVLEAPFTSVDDVAAGMFWYLPVRYLLRDHFNSLGKASKLTMPVLIVHGTKDNVVAYSYGKKLYDKIPSSKKELVTVEGAGHADLYNYKTGEAIDAFLEKL